MKAARINTPQTVQIDDVEYRKPELNFLTFEPRVTGICGSDLHVYHGDWDFSNQTGGHEVAGIVQEVGDGVNQFQPGDRIVVEAVGGCGECAYCKRGLYNLCVNRFIFWGEGHGGFAESATAHQSTVYKIPEEMTFEQGSLVEPLAVSYRAIMQAGATSQDRVAIIGGGSIGLLCLAVAKAIGVQETLMVVKYPKQAEIAESYGADHIVNISDTNVQEYCSQLDNDLGFDCVIESTGSETGFKDSLSIVRSHGTIVLVGVYTKPLSVDLGAIVGGELNVTGSNCYSYQGLINDFDATIELIASGKVDPTKIITHRFPLDEIVEAFKIADDKTTDSIKVNIYQ